MTCKYMRIMENNLAEVIDASISASSENSSYLATNAINRFRSKQWHATGRFTIDSTNTNIYTSDGNTTISTGEYTTPAALATEIQTQLNAIGSNWTCTYDSSGGTYKFTIANSASKTLTISTSTNAIWDTIGFTGSTDQTGTTFLADEQRNHTSETVTFDLGYAGTVRFFAAIGTLDEVFSISSDATVKLQGNNLDLWTAPPFEKTLTRYDSGIYQFLESETYADTNYRYWRFYIEDKKNPLGSDGCVKVSHIYIGDYVSLTDRNIASGFAKSVVDPSIRSESENGAIYFDTRTKYTVFTSMGYGYVDKDDRATLEQVYDRIGTTAPIYISLDPGLGISNTLDDLTKYVIYDSAPVMNHVVYDKFNYALSFREVV